MGQTSTRCKEAQDLVEKTVICDPLAKLLATSPRQAQGAQGDRAKAITRASGVGQEQEQQQDGGERIGEEEERNRRAKEGRSRGR
eukprot:187497-Hanusia_phi.AAC.1